MTFAFYDNYHFIIDRKGFANADKAGLYGAPAGDLEVEEIAPEYSTFQRLLNRYGGPWGWPQRLKYRDTAKVNGRLNEPETRLLVFREAGQEIGYCLIVGVKSQVKDAFWKCAQNTRIAEIENIAIDKNLTGAGRGQYLLEYVLRDLLSDYDGVYLSSRSTNHEGVPRFYLSMGMKLAHTEFNLPDDLTPAPLVRRIGAQQLARA